MFIRGHFAHLGRIEHMVLALIFYIDNHHLVGDVAYITLATLAFQGHCSWYTFL